jgi:hypothetical protein
VKGDEGHVISESVRTETAVTGIKGQSLVVKMGKETK